MSHRTRRVVAVLGAAALAIPSAAVAAPGKGKGPDDSDSAKRQGAGKAETRTKSKGKSRAKKVKLATYVVKGTYDGAGKVDVTGGNSHTRRAGLIRDDVEFDFSRARLVVADTDGDNRIDSDDLVAGDKLTIQLKLPRSLGEGPYVARKVVDRTHPRVSDDDVDATEIESESESERETETPSASDDSPGDE